MFRAAGWRPYLVGAVLVLCSAEAREARAQQPPTQPAGPSAAEVVARGRYVVENVALCGRCHTPVDVRGVRDRSRWLLGGQVGIESTVAVQGDWAVVAPRLAGTPPGTDAEFVTLMMTGVSRRGGSPRQPMPPFRLTRADAEAVLAYLKSLGARAVATPAPTASLTQK